MSRRTSLEIIDKRERRLEKASNIVANSPSDGPRMGVVIDAALAHLVQVEENLRRARNV